MESLDGHGSGGDWLVVMELSHIKELVRQLEAHLVGSPDLCKHLTAQISSLTDRSIGMVTSWASRKRSAADAGLASPPTPTPTPSPLSDVSDGPFKNTKKRKTMEKRRQQVRVSSTSPAGGETLVDDGHSWRKYGQKEILGTKNPRAYYRCTHRHSQGCAATKQVQRTDDDATLFDVIYHGDHTCAQRAAAAQTQPPERNPGAHGLLQSLGAGLTVKTEELPPAANPRATPFACFPLTPASACLPPERSPFSAPSTSENWGVVSPATSDSNLVPCFPPFEATIGGADWQHCEFQEVVSALVAASAPPSALDLGDDFDIDSFFA